MRQIVFLLVVVIAASVPLAAQAPSWQSVQNGKPPDQATPVGATDVQTVLYLARVAKGTVTSVGFYDPRTPTATIYDATGASQQSAFEIYTGGGAWVDAAAGSVPASALSASASPGGEPMPVVRVSSGGWLVPAAWSAPLNAAVAIVGGKRLLFSTFQVLVPDWAPATDAAALSQALRSAKDADGTDLVPLRAKQGKGLQVGKLRVANRAGYVGYGGKEVSVPGAVSQVFVGSGVWRPFGGRLPAGGIPAGVDDDGSTLYMARARQGTAEVLGKYNAKRNEALVPYGGAEVRVTTFDVLCYDLTPRGESQIVAQAAPAATAAPVAPVDASSALDSAVRASGLRPVLALRFDGNVSDSSPSPIPTANAAVTFATVDRATVGVFDGKRSKVDVVLAQPVTLERVTFMARVSSSFGKTWQAILDSSGWGPSAVHLQFAQNALELAVNGSQPTGFRPAFEFRPGVWYDIVVTYDAAYGSAAAYVDGRKIGAATYLSAVPYTLSRISVGAWDGEDRYFRGQIDHLYVLDGALSELEVAAYYQAASSTRAAAAAPPPARLQDRPAPAAGIKTSFGYAEIAGELDAQDGIRNGTYTDTFEYQAAAGGRIAIQAYANLVDEGALVPRLGVTAPDGATLAVSQIGGQNTLEATTAAGVYTIRVWAADPAALRGGYTLLLNAGGEETKGTLDPFTDSRDMGVVYDTVPLDVNRPGVYEITLAAVKFHNPVLSLRDSSSRVLTEDATSPDKSRLKVQAYLATGSYKAVIEDDLSGGDWKLVVAYLGTGGS